MSNDVRKNFPYVGFKARISMLAITIVAAQSMHSAILTVTPSANTPMLAGVRDAIARVAAR